MLKRTLTIVLGFIMMFSLLPASVFADDVSVVGEDNVVIATGEDVFEEESEEALETVVTSENIEEFETTEMVTEDDAGNKTEEAKLTEDDEALIETVVEDNVQTENITILTPIQDIEESEHDNKENTNNYADIVEISSKKEENNTTTNEYKVEYSDENTNKTVNDSPLEKAEEETVWEKEILANKKNVKTASSVILTFPVLGYTLNNLSQGFHDGKAIDIAAASGSTIVAAYGGKVTNVFRCSVQHAGQLYYNGCGCEGFGTGVVILGNDGRYYQYAHMQAQSIPASVYVGATVMQGQMIGKVGQTGAAYGVHLHFGISTGHYNNWSGINPANEKYSYNSNPIYTLTFKYDSNGGVGSMGNSQPAYNSKFTLPRCTFNKTGYTFKGWHLRRDNDSKWFQPNDGWVSKSVADSKGYSLYKDQAVFNQIESSFIRGCEYENQITFTWVAVWEPVKLTFKYNANGGSGSMSPDTQIFDQPYRLKKNVFTKTGYVFKGWHLKRDADNLWFRPTDGWVTQSTAEDKGYSRYNDQANFNKVESSFLRGKTDARTFTWYAVWEPVQKPVNVSAGNYIIMAKNSGGSDNTPKFLDVQNNKTVDETNIWIYTPTGHNGSIFEIGNSDGGYWVKGKTSGKVMDTYYSSQARYNSNVQIYYDKKNKGQRWIFEDAGDGYVYIRNLFGYYLERENSGTARTTNVRVWYWRGNDAQKWKLVKVSGTGKSQIEAGDYYLGGKSGSAIGVGQVGNYKDYVFSISQNNLFGSWQNLIKHKYTELCLATNANVSKPSENLASAANTTRYDGNWYFESAGGGYYYVRNLWGYYLTDKGTSVTTDVFTGRDNQKWELTKFLGPITVHSVSLDKSSLDIYVGDTKTINATVEPWLAENKSVQFTSSDRSIATVDTIGSGGTITAKKPGTAIITVTTLEGNKKATCKVTVKPRPVSVTGVKLDKTTANVTVGGNLQLKATIAPSNATNKAVIWKSSDTSIATVDSKGKVTAKKAGTATITVTTKDGNKKATCKVTVKANTVAVTGIKVSPTSSTLATKKTLQLKATITPSSATNKGVTWSSSNKNIATVDSTGKVTALRRGTVTITATSKANSKLKATCKITTRYYDVNDSSKYYYKAVYWAADKGMTTGYDNVYFAPAKACTRGEMVTFLWRLAGRPKVSGKTSFTDVEGKLNKNGDTYKAILWATKNGITKGYETGKYKGQFRTNDTVARKDSMIMLYRLAKKPKVSGKMTFPDCRSYNASSDTYKAIIWGTQKGITQGYADGKFKPMENCKREHIVTFIYRYSQKK